MRPPPTFTTTNNNISNRTKTSANVSWTFGSWSENTANQSPDISTIIQELVDDNGGLSNAPLVLILVPTGSKERSMLTYEKNTSTAPRLVITWTESSGCETFRTNPFITRRVSN